AGGKGRRGGTAWSRSRGWSCGTRRGIQQHRGASLRGSISTIWLNDVLDKALNPRLPEVRNSDGEEMVFLSLHYRLLSGVTAKHMRQLLDRLPDLRPESATFWNWLESNGPRFSALAVKGADG